MKLSPLSIAGVLLACILSCMFPRMAQANETPRSTSLDPVLVTASPVQGRLSDAMRSVTVITREDIETAPANNLTDLLAQVSGVTIQRRGAPGVQADAGIRGSSFEQTLVLVDGIPIGNPQTGHHNLNVPVPLEHVQRIEIIKGPGALQYGGSATGGVINIITRQPHKTTGGGTLMAGSHDTRRITAWLGGQNGRSSHMMSASRLHTDGEDPTKPTDADIVQALYSGERRYQSGRVHWGIGASNKDFGAWGFYSADFPDAREKTQSRLAWLGMDQQLGKWQADARVYWHGHDDWFLTRIAGNDYINRHNTRVAGLKASAQRSHDHGTTVFGINLRDADIKSNALGNEQRNKHSLWVLRQQQLGESLRAEIGINHVRYSDYGDYWLPSAALSWHINPRWRGFVSAARSARVPSYTELFLDTAANRGNPHLQPEQSDYYELGLVGSLATQRIELSLFQRDTEALIDWSRLPGETTWQAGNFDDYRARGMEIGWTWQPRTRWLEELGIAWDRLDVQIDQRGRQISYATRVPQQSWHAHLRMRLGSALGLTLDARRPDYPQQGTATLIGSRLDWLGETLQFSVEVRNLLDERIVEAGFLPIPGRWYYTSIGATF